MIEAVWKRVDRLVSVHSVDVDQALPVNRKRHTCEYRRSQTLSLKMIELTVKRGVNPSMRDGNCWQNAYNTPTSPQKIAPLAITHTHIYTYIHTHIYLSIYIHIHVHLYT